MGEDPCRAPGHQLAGNHSPGQPNHTRPTLGAVRPRPVTWQEAEGDKGFATKCSVSLASKIGGEVSTQEPTELGRDVEQPGSITASAEKA